MHRAYSLLHVKEVDGDRRTFSGIATTPTPDRVQDVVEPKGARFRNPLPLLLFHDGRLPVGEAKFGRPTDDGIPFTASIPNVAEPGRLKERTDEAWHSVKYGVIKGVSIRFAPSDNGVEVLRSGGMRFTDFEVLELSLVPIPANAEATIQSIKSFDAPYLAASGEGVGRVTENTPRVVGTVVTRSVTSRTPMKKTIQEQIKDFEATRASKVAERDAIMDAASETGTTLDAAQTEQYDGLDAEVKSIDEHLKRMRAREVEMKAAAVEVKGSTQAEATASRGHQVIMARVNREPGIGFARFVMAKMASFMSMKEGGFMSALDIAQRRWPSDTELHAHIKANIAAGTTTDTNWATELVEPTTLGSEFLEFLRAMTIVGKFGRDGVPALKSLPFNTRIARMTSGLTGNWVGEGLAKPASKGAVDAVTLPYHKVAALTVITQELARFSSPSAERVVRDDLARAVSARLDADFVDPAITATTARPASITNGLAALSSAGTSADNARTDVMNLIEYFILNHMDVSSLVLLMPNTLALALSILRNSLGQQEFPGLTLNGGRLEGIPVITSQYLASSASYGNMIVALAADSIGLADDGAVDIKVSDQATIEMSDTPAGDATTPTAGSTAYVSMFQTNSLAILAERFITWKKLRSTAVVFMDDVNWGAIGSPV